MIKLQCSRPKWEIVPYDPLANLAWLAALVFVVCSCGSNAQINQAAQMSEAAASRAGIAASSAQVAADQAEAAAQKADVGASIAKGAM
ncbi:MAG: hypothetical protein WA231_20225, partial [Methylocella sp.]